MRKFSVADAKLCQFSGCVASQASNASASGGSSLLPPARTSFFCPLTILAVLGIAMQIIFLTNAGNIRDN